MNFECDSRLRWGILGTGRIATKFAETLIASKTGVLAAVGSRTRASAEAFTASHGGATAHASYEALLADRAVDAVYLSTPHPVHAEWAEKAAAAGKHILCEKPLAMNAAGARRMIAAAERHNVFLMEAFMYRPHPQTGRIVEILRSGALGELRSVRASFSFCVPFDAEHRLFSKALGGGALLDVGCYCVSMLRLAAGAAVGQPFANPERVFASAQLGETGVDEHTVGILEFAGGIHGHFSCGLRVAEESEVVIHGTEARLHVPIPWFPGEGGACELHLILNGQPPKVIRIEAPASLYSYEIDEVARCLAEGESASMSKADTLGNMETLDRLRQAVALRYAADG